MEFFFILSCPPFAFFALFFNRWWISSDLGPQESLIFVYEFSQGDTPLLLSFCVRETPISLTIGSFVTDAYAPTSDQRLYPPIKIYQGNGAGTALLAFMFLFSGFFVPYNSIPKGWRWFSALSMFKYPLEAMTKNMIEEEEDRSGNEEVCPVFLFEVLSFIASKGYKTTSSCAVRDEGSKVAASYCCC